MNAIYNFGNNTFTMMAGFQTERRGVKRGREDDDSTKNSYEYSNKNWRTSSAICIEQRIAELRAQMQCTSQEERELQRLCVLLQEQYGYTEEYVNSINMISSIDW